MTDLTRIPVVVGGGQFTNQIEDPSSAPDPFELMTEAAKLAASDAGAGGTDGGAGSSGWLGRLTHCWTVHSLSLRHADPAAEIARRIGAPANTETRCSGMGGNIPQWLVNRGGRPRQLRITTGRARRRRRGARDAQARQEGGRESGLAVF